MKRVPLSANQPWVFGPICDRPSSSESQHLTIHAIRRAGHLQFRSNQPLCHPPGRCSANAKEESTSIPSLIAVSPSTQHPYISQWFTRSFSGQALVRPAKHAPYSFPATNLTTCRPLRSGMATRYSNAPTIRKRFPPGLPHLRHYRRRLWILASGSGKSATKDTRRTEEEAIGETRKASSCSRTNDVNRIEGSAMRG